MESHPDIARGFHKGSKGELEKFWKTVELRLNSAGPPMKNIAEWKKVWVNQKKYVWRKASQNLTLRRGTGGGPNLEKKLTITEEAIYNLIAMKDCLEGVAVPRFGLGEETEPTDQTEMLLDDDATPMQEFFDVQYLEPETGEAEGSFEGPSCSKNIRQKQKGKQLDAVALIQNEIEVQKELCSKIEEFVINMMEQNENQTKQITTAINKMKNLQKNHFKKMEQIEEANIKEMERRNRVMEDLQRKQFAK